MAIKQTELRTTAGGFATVALVFACICILPMAWMIPMTKAIKRDIRENKKIPLALSICYFIFGGLFAMVTAILLFIDYGKNK